MELMAASFSGHESFPFRNTWLTKGVTQCALDPTFFSRDDAMVVLGVGKNMVRSIRHWCLATEMVVEDPGVGNNRGRYLCPSELGRRIFLGTAPWDPYLEDSATLWLIHYQLVTSDSRATTWYYAFNEVNQPEFTRHGLEQAIGALARRYGVRVSTNSIARDVDVFIRTYAGSGAHGGSLEESLDCPLAELGLIFQPTPTSPYAFARGPKGTLPDAVFVYALWQFATRHPHRKTFTFDELMYTPRGPGRAFRLDEASLADRLEQLGKLTGDVLQFSETAGLKQVLIQGDPDPLAMLADYYHGGAVPGAGR